MSEFREHAVGGALESRAGDDRRHGHHALAPRSESGVETGECPHRPDRHDRVRRCDDDGPRSAQFVEAERGGAVGTVESNGAHGHVVTQLDEVFLESDVASVGERHDRRHAVVRHRQDAETDAEGPHDLGGDLCERRTLGETCRAVEVRRKITVAEAEPVFAGT